MSEERTKLNQVTGSEIVVSLKMAGSKRNQDKIQRMVASAINDRLANMSWSFTGSGKVEVEWDIHLQNAEGMARRPSNGGASQHQHEPES